MKVKMTFAVEWTTKAVEKEPDEIQNSGLIDRESNPDIRDDRTQRTIHWANRANWRAGHSCSKAG